MNKEEKKNKDKNGGFWSKMFGGSKDKEKEKNVKEQIKK